VGSARGQTSSKKKPQLDQKQKDESKAKLSEADLVEAVAILGIASAALERSQTGGQPLF